MGLDYGLQVQQCLQFGLFTSIKRVLGKLGLLRNDEPLDVLFQLLYADHRLLRGAIPRPCRLLIVVVRKRRI